jgi:hypothetical protein
MCSNRTEKIAMQIGEFPGWADLSVDNKCPHRRLRMGMAPVNAELGELANPGRVIAELVSAREPGD